MRNKEKTAETSREEEEGEEQPRGADSRQK